MKIVEFSQLLDIISDLNAPERDMLVEKAEALATEIADVIAAKLWVRHQGGDYRFGGLCVTFRPATPDQACPELIAAADVGGDWE